MKKETKATQEKKPNPPSMNKKLIIAILVVLILAMAGYLLKGELIVATVNGKPIFRHTLIAELEKTSGKQALDTLIARTLILQEAKRKNVSISDEEISQEIEKISQQVESQGQSLEQILAFQGLTRKDLEGQIRVQKIAEKLVGASVEVSDEEAAEYFENNKSMFSEGTTFDQVKEEIKNQLKQEKINQEIQAWFDNLKKSAKINYFKFN